jgi:hypothetical protein
MILCDIGYTQKLTIGYYAKEILLSKHNNQLVLPNDITAFIIQQVDISQYFFPNETQKIIFYPYSVVNL